MINKFDGHNRFLSNFYASEVVFGEELYPTVEHAFAAAKTTDLEVRDEIRAAKTPGEAKRLGRKLVLRKEWTDENYRLDVMYMLVREKFFRNSDLRDRLLNTRPVELVEGNTWGDTFWGVCNGVGTNHLGKILMRVRKELK